MISKPDYLPNSKIEVYYYPIVFPLFSQAAIGLDLRSSNPNELGFDHSQCLVAGLLCSHWLWEYTDSISWKCLRCRWCWKRMDIGWNGWVLTYSNMSYSSRGGQGGYSFRISTNMLVLAKSSEKAFPLRASRTAGKVGAKLIGLGRQQKRQPLARQGHDPSKQKKPSSMRGLSQTAALHKAAQMGRNLQSRRRGTKIEMRVHKVWDILY